MLLNMNEFTELFWSTIELFLWVANQNDAELGIHAGVRSPTTSMGYGAAITASTAICGLDSSCAGSIATKTDNKFCRFPRSHGIAG